jgi:RNA recognition motif-containing protein
LTSPTILVLLLIFIFLYYFRMNIYIGNLNYRVRESDLQQILEEYGVVDSVKIIVDRDTKRSKGFAFAEMPNAAEAQKAIEELNQAEYEGRQMVVKEAIPRR